MSELYITIIMLLVIASCADSDVLQVIAWLAALVGVVVLITVHVICALFGVEVH